MFIYVHNSPIFYVAEQAWLWEIERGLSLSERGLSLRSAFDYILLFLFWLEDLGSRLGHSWLGDCFTWQGLSRGSFPARHSQGWSGQCVPESAFHTIVNGVNGSWSNGSTIFENKYFQSSLGLLSLISFVRFQRHPMKFNFLGHSVIFFTRSNYIFNNIQFFDEIQLYFWRDSPLVALGKTTHCYFGFLSPEQRF